MTPLQSRHHCLRNPAGQGDPGEHLYPRTGLQWLGTGQGQSNDGGKIMDRIMTEVDPKINWEWDVDQLAFSIKWSRLLLTKILVKFSRRVELKKITRTQGSMEAHRSLSRPHGMLAPLITLMSLVFKLRRNVTLNVNLLSWMQNTRLLDLFLSHWVPWDSSLL